jgi:hypothetical protein
MVRLNVKRLNCIFVLEPWLGFCSERYIDDVSTDSYGVFFQDCRTMVRVSSMLSLAPEP